MSCFRCRGVPCQCGRARVGDIIEHQLLPGFRMTVQAVEPCETDGARPEPHPRYRVTDPKGDPDWLCAHDVQRVGGAS